MMSPAALVLLSLASWLVPIVWLAVAERRGRSRYRTRRGTAYRRISTEDMLKDVARRKG